MSGEDGGGRCKGSQSRRLPGEFQGQQEAVWLEQSPGEQKSSEQQGQATQGRCTEA